MWSFDLDMEQARWIAKLLVALTVVTTMKHNFQIEAGKLQIPHKEFVNSTKRHYVVTTEETEDTFFIPQPAQVPALIPNYPVSVITQPAPRVDTHEHAHTHEHEHENTHEHAYLHKHKKGHSHEPTHEQEMSSSKSYRAIGCYKDAIPRAVPSLEGSDSDLGEYYKNRENAVEKCARVAKARGYEIFTVQNGGFCSSGAHAHSTFQIYGPAKNCRNGRGGEWASDVYIFNDYIYELTVHTGTEEKSSTNAKVSITLYGSLGSSKNIALKADISSKNPFQNGQVDKFLAHTIPLGDLVRLHICHDNTGPLAEWYLEKVSIKDSKNQIYIFPCNCWLKHDKSDEQSERNLFPATVLNSGSIKHLGCYQERHKSKAIHGINKEDEILDGHPSSAINKREHVIEKCAHVARQRRHLFFEIHNGRECFTSSTIQDTYGMYGSAVSCNMNDKGGVSTKAVYTFPDQEPISTSTTDTSLNSFGMQ